MKQEETIALWRMCQVAKRAMLDRGIAENEAQEAAQKVWNHWAQPLIDKKTAMIEAGEWALATDSYGNLVGENNQTQDWLEKAYIDFSDVMFLLRGKASETIVLADGLSVVEVEDMEEDMEDATVLCGEGAEISFKGFIFAGMANFDGAIFAGDVNVQVMSFLHYEDVDYANFSNTDFRKGIKG